VQCIITQLIAEDTLYKTQNNMSNLWTSFYLKG